MDPQLPHITELECEQTELVSCAIMLYFAVQSCSMLVTIKLMTASCIYVLVTLHFLPYDLSTGVAIFL